MKNMILILSMLLFIAGCSQEEAKQQDNTVYGNWKLTKRTANNIDGSSNNWENVKNGVNIIFDEDFIFKSNEFTVCNNYTNNGVFKLNEITESDIIKKTIEITINNCQKKPNGIFTRSFYYSFSGNSLILIPKKPACFEGCAFLYKKIR